MSRNVWIPLIAAAACHTVTAFLMLVLPETGPIPIHQEAEGAASNTISGHLVQETVNSSLLGARARARVRHFLTSIGFVLQDRNVIMLLVSFLVSKIGRQSTSILIQYVSKRYDWSIAHAGLLLSVRAAVNIILFVAILPALATFLLRLTDGQAPVRDLFLARGSAFFLVAGSILLSLAPTRAFMIVGLVVLTLGMGLPPAARSLVTSLVERSTTEGSSKIGLLYAIISVMEGVGSLLGAVLLTGSLRIGFRLGGAWLGLPFIVCTGLFALACSMTILVKPRSMGDMFC